LGNFFEQLAGFGNITLDKGGWGMRVRAVTCLEERVDYGEAVGAQMHSWAHCWN